MFCKKKPEKKVILKDEYLLLEANGEFAVCRKTSGGKIDFFNLSGNNPGNREDDRWDVAVSQDRHWTKYKARAEKYYNRLVAGDK